VLDRFAVAAKALGSPGAMRASSGGATVETTASKRSVRRDVSISKRPPPAAGEIALKRRTGSAVSTAPPSLPISSASRRAMEPKPPPSSMRRLIPWRALLDRLDLADDVDAVLVGLEHAQHALQVPRDALRPADDVLAFLVSHGREGADASIDCQAHPWGRGSLVGGNRSLGVGRPWRWLRESRVAG